MPQLCLPSVELNYMQLPCSPASPLDGEADGQPSSCNNLVLIHGLAANLAFWHAGIAMPLRHVANLVSYDLRGHGHSSAPSSGYRAEQMVDDLLQLLDHLGIERAHLLAHSFGGTIAVLFALHHPERVQSLILADSRLRAIQPRQPLSEWSHWPQWQKMLRRAGIELDENDPEGGYQMLIEMARLQEENPQMARHLPRLFSMGGGGRARGRRRANVAMRWLRIQEETSIRSDFANDDSIHVEDLKRLKMPVLGLYGEYSNTLPTARAMQRICPNYHLHIIAKAGHFFPLSQPKRLVRATMRFLAAQRDGTLINGEQA